MRTRELLLPPVVYHFHPPFRLIAIKRRLAHFVEHELHEKAWFWATGMPVDGSSYNGHPRQFGTAQVIGHHLAISATAILPRRYST